MESIVLKRLKESQQLEESGNLEEALSITEEMSSKFPENIDLFVRRVYLCNKLQGPYYLFKSKSLLNDWVSQHKKSNKPLEKEVVLLYSLTLNNTALEQQSNKKYHKALSFLMRAIKFLESHEFESLDYSISFAKTKLNLSSLFYELRKYNESISQAEIALKFLQNHIENSKKIKQDDKLYEVYYTYIKALYNIGNSEESMGNPLKAKVAFLNALQLNKRHIPVTDPLMVSIRKALGEDVDENATISKRSKSELFNQKIYSHKQSNNMWNRINSGNSIAGLSHDLFDKIQKKLQIEYVKTSAMEELKIIDQEDQKLKRNILNLRLKKRFPSNKSIQSVNYVKLRIENLKDTDENRASAFDRQLKSSVRSFFRERKCHRDERSSGLRTPTPSKITNIMDSHKKVPLVRRLDFSDRNRKISESLSPKVFLSRPYN